METATPAIIHSFYRMLLELASGPTRFRIRYTGTCTAVQDLAEFFNDIAVKANRTAEMHIQTAALPMFPELPLDTFADREYFNSSLQLLLYLPLKTLDLSITGQSPVILNALLTAIQRRSSYSHVVQLGFKTPRGAQVIVTCSVIVPHGSDKVQLYMLALRNGEPHEERPRQILFDSQLFDQVKLYILANLHVQLPQIKVLARIFGTNEFTLKAGFRHFYKTSIYQFYNDRRLVKAHDMLYSTALPIIEIAELCGFASYANFGRAFKRKFGYPPGALREQR